MASRQRPTPPSGSGRDGVRRRPPGGSPTARRTAKPTTSGASAAGRRATKAPHGSTAVDVTPRASRARFTGRAVVVVVVRAVLAVSYASSARAWLKQRSDIAALQAEIADRRTAVAELEQTERRWSDPAYIESQARQRFGWVMPGETVYRVIDSDGTVLSDGTSELTDPPGPEAPLPELWWEKGWGSVLEAGRVESSAPPKPERRPATSIGGRPGGGNRAEERRDRGPGARGGRSHAPDTMEEAELAPTRMRLP